MSPYLDDNVISIDFQLNGSIMVETPASHFYPPSPYIGANLIANGHITNAQCKFEQSTGYFRSQTVLAYNIKYEMVIIICKINLLCSYDRRYLRNI